MSVIVFLGPTLPVEDARQILDATYLPPVRMGDVLAVLNRRPVAIGIVDGFFEQVPAVWHKEILYALESGVRVFGASSMGALRAAELWSFGMEGVGTIFEAFRDGALEDDDEVAIVHGPGDDGYRPLSQALANIRAGLDRARDAGIISHDIATQLVSMAKATFYAERSWQGLLTLAAQAGVAHECLQALRRFLEREQPNQKRDDAIAMLRRMRDVLAERAAWQPPSFRLERTAFWNRLADSVTTGRQTDKATEGVTLEHVRDHVCVARPDWSELQRAALLLGLVDVTARQLGIALSADTVKRGMQRVRRRLGLLSAADTERWLIENGMTHVDLARLAELEARYEAVLNHCSAEIGPLLVTELRRRGEGAEALKTTVEQRRFLRERAMENPTLAEAGVELGEVLAWYRAKGHLMHGDLEEHARTLGFGSARVFLAELLAQFLVERHGRHEPITGVEPRPLGDEGIEELRGSGSAVFGGTMETTRP